MTCKFLHKVRIRSNSILYSFMIFYVHMKSNVTGADLSNANINSAFCLFVCYYYL